MRLNRCGYDAQITHSCALHHAGSQTVARQDVRKELGDFPVLNKPKFFKKWSLEHRLGDQMMVHNSVVILNGQDEYPKRVIK
jgi:hypothetical protein